MQLLYERKDVNTKSNMYCIDFFLCSKVYDIAIRSPFLHRYCVTNDTDETTVFVGRVSQEGEKKLKEFNLKVLHGILAFGVGLRKCEIRNRAYQCM